MKRTLKLALAAFLAVIASVSCTKEQAGRQPETKVDGMRTIKIVSDVVTKTTLDTGDKPVWAKGDKVAVLGGSTAYTAEVLEAYEGQATFLVPEELSGDLKAVYPFGAYESASDYVNKEGEETPLYFAARVNIYKNGEWKIDGSFGTANVAVGKTIANDVIALKNAVALLEVTKLPAAGTLSLSKYSTALADVYFDGNNNLQVFAAPTEATKPAVSFDVDGDNTKKYYIPVFPGTKTEELELTFKPTSGDAQVMYLKTGVTLARNTIYPVDWRYAPVIAQTYEGLNAELKNSNIYPDNPNVPVQIEMTMDDDQDGNNNIIFPSPADNRAISLVLSGETETINIYNDTGANGPATLLITAPENTSLDINTPNTHVILNGKEYTQVKSASSASTLVISKDVTVDKLILVQGGLEVHGELNSVEIADPHGEIVVRDCEGLDNNVYQVLRPHIATGYKAVQNGSTYDIVPAEGVAKIGTTAYPTLEAAVKAVKDGETISIIAERLSATVIDVNKNFTIDLGGKEVIVAGPAVGSSQTMNQALQIKKGNTVTIKDGSLKCDNTNNIFRFVIQNYADLTLKDVVVDGTNLKKDGKTDAYTISGNYGTVTFTGSTSVKASTVSGVDAYAIDLYDYTSQSTYDRAGYGVWNSEGSVEGIISIGGGKLTVSKELKLNKPVKVYKGDSDVASELIVDSNIIPVTGWTSTNNGGDALVVVKRGGNLSIKGSGKISYNGQTGVYAAAKVTEKGESSTGATAKLSVGGSVILEGYYYGIVGNGDRSNTEITVDGGTVKGVKENDCTGIYHPQRGKLTINGGTIEGATGIYVKSGDVTASISAGTIKGAGTSCKAYDPNRKGDGCDPTGDALVIDNCGYPGGVPTVKILGGTFVSDKHDAVRSYALTGHTPVTGFIEGGIFSSKPEGSYLKDGYVVAKNAQGQYEARLLGDSDVATIDGLAYQDLASALKALKAGENLKIWKAGEYTVQTLSTPANTTVEGMAANRGVVFKHTAAATSWVASSAEGRVVKNITWNVGVANHQYLHGVDLVNCKVIGLLCTHTNNDYTDCEFYNDAEYNIWEYGTGSTFTRCKFTCPGNTKAAVNAYNEGQQGMVVVVFENCEFVALNQSENYSAVYIKPESDFDVRFTDCTFNDKFADGAISGSKLWNVKNNSNLKTKVTVDGQLVYAEGTVLYLTTADQLMEFAAKVNGGKNFENTTVTLGADIDMTGKQWIPIGNVNDYPGKAFYGVFDGQNHTISNLTCTDHTENYACAGLFGSLMGTVRNVTLKNVNITSSHYAGGICAFSSSSGSKVDNCKVIGGTITSAPELLTSGYDNGDKAGGIFGYNGEGGPITGCTVEGLTIRAYRDIGGIVGAGRGTISGCSVKNTTIIQDNTNAYQGSVDTYKEILGRDLGNATLMNNTYSEVTLKSQ